MNLIIDGHNLVPHVSGLHLEDIDDEQQLISRLQHYCRIKRSKVNIYFDKASIGYGGSRSYGAVVAHFVQQGRTADDAIITHLQRLKKSAKNYVVVSSDRMVTAAARSMHAKVISSDDFARDLIKLPASQKAVPIQERELSEEELAYWQTMFEAKDLPE